MSRSSRNSYRRALATLGVTVLEDRTLPSQLVYLHGGGAADLTYRGPVVVDDLDIPAFSAAAVGAAGDEAAILARVAADLTARSAGTVAFTTTRPTVGAYSTVYVGGTDGRFALWGGRYFGLAEANDPGNARPDDRAWVFSDTIADALEVPSRESLTAALSDVVWHEAVVRLIDGTTPGEGDGPLDAVAAPGPSYFQYPIVPAGGDGRRDAGINQYFGGNHGSLRGHLGMDFKGGTGTPVYAIADGKVTEVKDVGGGWGKIVIVEHKTTQWGWDKDVYSMYAHVDGITVSRGQYVRRGQQLCVVGPTAQGSSGPHLHLEIRSGIRAWWQPGPGYKGNDFSRLSSPTVTRADYPDIKWHDPLKIISQNLYPVEVWVSNPAPRAGETIIASMRVPTSALPTGPGSTIDLSNVRVTLALPGLSSQAVMVAAANPNVLTGQGATLTTDNFLVVSGPLVISETAPRGVTYSPVGTLQTGAGSLLTTVAPVGVAASEGYSDTVQAFLDRPAFAGIAPTAQGRLDWLQKYAASLLPAATGPELLMHDSGTVVRDQLVEWIAARALRIEDALPAAQVAGATDVAFTVGLRQAFGADLLDLQRPWNNNLPTVILVHGIFVNRSFHDTVGDPLATELAGQANVITVHAGWTSDYLGRVEELVAPGEQSQLAVFRDRYVNGLARNFPQIIKDGTRPFDAGGTFGSAGYDAVLGALRAMGFNGAVASAVFRHVATAWARNDSDTQLQLAVDLHLLVKLLNRRYGERAATSINLVAHSQGTLITTAALTFQQPPLQPAGASQDYAINRAVFIGANLTEHATAAGRELFRVPLSRRKVTNLTSVDDSIVGIGSRSYYTYLGYDHGAGRYGFVSTLTGVAEVPLAGDLLRLNDRTVSVRHIGEYDPTAGTVGWWDWLIRKEDESDLLYTLIRPGGDGYPGGSLRQGGEAVSLRPAAPGEPTEPEDGAVVSRTFVASLGYDYALGGVQYFATAPRPGRTQVAPTITRVDLRSATVFRGELVVGTAVGAADADGRVARLEAFLDADGNAHPDAGELVGVDYHPGGGFRVAVNTRDLAPGNYTLVFRVADDEGNFSELVTAVFQVLEPGAPPPQVPASLPPGTKPNYGIVVKQNGDVTYAPDNYTLTRNRPDLWQITLATGGGVTIRTTGTTDTVLGLFDADTGQLLAFDEDNGPGNNAELTRTLVAGKTYLVLAAAQRGSFGDYGLDVTGPNQVVAATLAPAAPLYAASAAGAVAFANDVKYFAVTAPAGATRMSVVLDGAATLDGFVRVENAAHETVATAFLAGTGADDRLADVPVVAGQQYFVTVTGMYGTAGAFEVRVDFDPDARTLPDEIVPVPVAALRQLVTPPGGFLELDATLASAGTFHYYLLTPAQTGEFVFDVRGDFDAQAGLYAYNGAANATLIASDDDSGGAGNPRLVRPLTGGNQYLLVVRADGPTAGAYRLGVQQAVRDAAGRIQLFGLESVGSRSGSYASNARYAHYQFDTPVNATTMTVRVTLLPNLSMLDATLRVTDATGVVVGIGNAAGRGGAEQLVNLSARPGETYTVTVYGSDVTAGDYVIDVDVDPNFSPSGGTEFSVAEEFGDQSAPAVGRNAAGHTVVAWVNWGSTRELRVQRYATTGLPAGGVLTVNTGGEPSGRPDVAVAADGSFAVVWSRGNDIYLRRYSDTGSPTTGEVLVGLAGQLSAEPRVAVAPNGSFAVVWTSFNHGDPDGGIYGRLVTAAGAATGAEFHANTTTPNYQGGPDVAFRPDGSFLVVWHSVVGSELALTGRRFAADGSPAGAEFRVNGSGRALYPSLAVGPDGVAVVAWKNHTGSGVESIRARRLAATDALLGTEVVVSQGLTPLDFEADVALGAGGQFVVSWTTSVETDGSGIAAQAFLADGTRTGPEYILNQQRANPQTRAVLAGTSSDTLFAAWQSNAGGSVAENVRGLTFTLGPTRQPVLRLTDSRGTADDHFIDFGRFAAPVSGVTQTVTFHNDGTAALEVTNLELYGAGAASFTVAGPTTFSVPAGGSRAVTLLYSGADGGAFAGLRFGHNNPHEGSVGWVNLLGEVAKPTFEVGFTDANAAEGTAAGVVFVRVARVNADTAAPLTVSLASSAAGRLGVPVSAVIPAGEDAVLVPVTLPENTVPGDTATVAVTASAAGFVTGTDGLEVLDNEPGGVLVRATGSGTAVVEGGAVDTYTIVLTARPTASVTVTVSPDAQLTAAPGTVTFTPDDWATPQAVTVTAVNDGVEEGTHVGTVAHSVASADPVYHGVAAAGLTAQVSEPVLPPQFPLAFGGAGGDVGSGVAVDAAGNVYVAGEFQGTADFDPGAGTTTRTSAGGTDGFVAKFGPAGNLLWVTAVGGAAADFFFDVAVDAAGNVYAVGSTASAGLATAGAAQPTYGGGPTDGLVVKLSPAGAVVYTTYLGGGRNDDLRGVAVDATGSAYVTGSSDSFDYPTASAVQGTFGGAIDLVVARLNPAGSALVFSTYLGRVGSDLGAAIALDAAGNAYVAGYTRSSNFPTTAGAYQTTFRGSADGIVVKFSPSGSLVYSTLLGGNDPLGEGLAAIVVDAAGRAHVVGGGGSPDYPLVNALPGAGGSTYVSTLSADGSALLFSTALGADGGASGIAVDAAGALYVTGTTAGGTLMSTDGSTLAGGSDAFLVKLLPGAAGGTRLGYASFFGGTGTDIGRALAVDADRNVTLLATFAGTADLAFGGVVLRTSAGGDDVGVVRVTGANHAPVAAADAANSARGAAVSVNVLANDADADGDPLAVSVVTAPAHGTAVVDTRGTPADPTDDRVVYTPAAGFTGTDRFRYQVADPAGTAAAAWVTVTVTPAPPTTLLDDDFNDNSLNGAKWRVDTTVATGSAGVTETNQRVQFANRGHLISQGQFDPRVVGPLYVSGTWTFTNTAWPAFDFLQLLTRSDGVPTGAYGETRNGIEFRVVAGNALAIEERFGGNSAALAFVPIARPFVAGEALTFEAFDDGTNLSLTVRAADGTTTTVTATSTRQYAVNHVVFHNREFNNSLPTLSYLDDVLVATGPPLTLTLAAPTVTENATGVVATVSRGTPGAADLVVRLSVNDADQATHPATVTIPAGQATATFTLRPTDDALLDGDRAVLVTASAVGFVPGVATLAVTDHEQLRVTLDRPAVAETAGAGAATATVTRPNTDTAAALVVTLTSSDTSEAGVPASVTIPAGEASVTFLISAADDLIADGTQAVTFTAAAPGYVPGTAALAVTDDEFPVATAGSLDPTFGTGGRVATDILGLDNAVQSMAVQADGKVVVAGTVGAGMAADFVVARYHPDGTPDTSFGTGGRVVTDFGGRRDFARAVVIQPDGKIVVGGWSTTTLDDMDSNFTLARLLPDGTLDPSFGTGGRVQVNLSWNDGINGLALQSDGMLVAVGLAHNNLNADVGIARFTPAGALDPTFGGGGFVATNTIQGLEDVLVLPDGSLLVGGSVVAPGGYDFAVARYSAAGVQQWRTTLDFFGSSDQVERLVRQPDGRVLAVGYAHSAARGTDVALLRINPDGSRDTTFGTNGVVVTPVAAGAGFDYGTDAVVQADGRIVVVGSTVRDGTTDFLVVRYSGAGVQEAAFGTGGAGVTDFAGGADVAVGVVLQADGRAVVGGSVTRPDTGTDFGLARYLMHDGDRGLLVAVGAPLAEDAAAPLTATLRRTGADLSAALVVTLSSSDTTELTVPVTVTIPAGQATATFALTAVDDALLDGTQVVTVTATAAGFAPGQAAVDVFDREALTLTIAAAAVSEAGGTTTATVTRSDAAAAAALVVTLASSDATALGVPLTVTIPAGQASATFTIAATDDTLLDGTQVVTVSATAAGYASGAVDMDVLDHEALTLSVAPASAAEGGFTTGTVTRGNTDTAAALVVSLASGDTTEATVQFAVTIPAGAASVTFAITAADDALFDGTQVVTLTATAAGYVGGSAVVSVTDAEMLTLTFDAGTVAEDAGVGALTGTVSRSNADVGGALVVALSSSDTSELRVPLTVTIPAGAMSATFAADAIDDALLDGPQTVTVDVTADGYVGGAATVLVTDREALTVVLSAGTVREDAGAGVVTGTVTRSNTDVGGPLVVALVSSDTSELHVPLTVTIPAGAASATFAVAVVDDTLLDGPQALTVGASAAGYAVGSANLTVTDAEAVTVAFGGVAVAEDAGVGALTGTVSRSNADVGGALVVALSSSDTSELRVPLTVTIPAGAMSATFAADAVDDVLLDGTQTVTVDVTADGYVGGAATVLVTDREALALSLSVGVAVEGFTPVTGTVSRSNTDTGSALVVALVSSDPSEARLPATVTIPAGAAAVSFAVEAVEDGTPDGTQPATLSAAAAGYAGGSAVLLVTDLGTLAVTFSTAAAVEGAGPGAVVGTVTRGNADLAVALVVTLSSSDPSEARVPATVTIPAGAAAATFAVDVIDDSLLDGTQLVTIGAAAPAFAAGSAVLSVADREVLALSFAAGSVAENAGAAALTGTVTRGNTDVGSPLVVTLVSSDTTELHVPLTVTIPAGAAAATFAADAVDDALLDGPQAVTVTAAAAGYPAGATAVQVADAEALALAFGAAQMLENPAAGRVSLAVRRGNADVSAPLTVTLTTDRPGLLDLPAQVTIPAGLAEVTLSVGGTDDFVAQGARAVVVAATAPGYAGAAAALTVTDDDRPGVVVVAPSGGVALAEGGPAVAFTVALGSQPAAAVVVTLAPPAGVLLTPAALTFTPADWAVARTVEARAAADNVAQGPRSGVVTFTVSGEPGYAGLAVAPLPVSVADAPRRSASLVVSGPAGAVTAYPPNAGGRYDSSAAVLTPFGATPVRVAAADVDGDGVADAVLVTGPGAPVRAAVVSGADNRTLLVAPFDPFGGDFTGGGFVAAADVDGDGRAEFVVTPDRGGGPRVSVFSLAAGGSAARRANFFGIDDDSFRGGARAALGDVNRDGTPDLAVSAGFLGGPRTALFDGATLFAAPARLVNDFFAFPGSDAETLRNGVFVAAGDVDGDGFAELVFGGGPGGAPRVFVLSGARLSAGDVAGAQASPVANFFVAGNAADRGGVRVALTDADSDGRGEVVAGSGEGAPGGVRVYFGAGFGGGGESGLNQDLDPFGRGPLTDGVYVG